MAALTAGEPAVSQKKSRRHILWSIVAVGLAVVLLVLLIRAADWGLVGQQLRHANLSILLFAWIVLGSLGCAMRAIRWYVLLSGQGKISFWPVFWANSSGNFANSVLPARAGEFIRAAMVSGKSDLTTRFVLAVALCERIFDMLVLVALTRIGLSYISSLPSAFQRAMSVALWGSLCVVVLLVVAAQSQKITNLVLCPGLRPLAAVLRHLEPFVDGIRTIRNRKRLFLFFLLTLPIWFVDAWGAKLIAASLGVQLPFPVALILLAALACSSLLPTTPGQLGVFQFVTIRVLAIASIEYNQALAYSLVLQAGAYLVFAFWGIPGLWMYRKTWKIPMEKALHPAETPDRCPAIGH